MPNKNFGYWLFGISTAIFLIFVATAVITDSEVHGLATVPLLTGITGIFIIGKNKRKKNR